MQISDSSRRRHGLLDRFHALIIKSRRKRVFYNKVLARGQHIKSLFEQGAKREKKKKKKEQERRGRGKRSRPWLNESKKQNKGTQQISKY